MRNRWPLADSTLVLVTVGIALAGFGVARFGFQHFRDSHERIKDSYESASRLSLAAERLRGSTERCYRTVTRFMLSGETALLEELRNTRVRQDNDLRAFAREVSPQNEKQLQVIVKDLEVAKRNSDAAIQRRLLGDTPKEVLHEFESSVIPSRDRLDQRLAAMSEEAQLQHQRIVKAAETASTRLMHMVWTSMLGIASVILVVGVLLVRNVRQRQLSQARFSGMVELSDEAIVSVDADRRICLFNQGAEHIFGYRRDEVLGQSIDMILPGYLREARNSGLEGLSGKATVWSHGGSREVIGVRAGGGVFPAEGAISRVEVAGQRYLTSMLRDVSEQRQREREQHFLAEAGRVLTSSLDSKVMMTRLAELAVPVVADWVLVYLRQDDGRICRIKVTGHGWNWKETARELENYPIDLERPFLGHEAAVGDTRLFEPMITPGYLENISQCEAHRKLIDRLKPVSIIGVPLLARERHAGGIVFLSSTRVYSHDQLNLVVELGQMAALALTNAELFNNVQSALRSRDEMLGVVVHDLRNPLMGIELAAGLLKASPESPPRVATVAGQIGDSTRYMGRLIQDLVDVVRVESGKLTMTGRRHSLVDLVTRAVSASQQPEGAVRLQVELPQRLPPVFVDGDRVVQVLVNLLSNAIKFTPPGGEVRLSARQLEDEIEVLVEDKGCGMSQEQVAHVFDRFWQAAPTDRRGLGLGLAIAKGIVEASGGRIWVESALGQGTRIFFTLPSVGSSGVHRIHEVAA